MSLWRERHQLLKLLIALVVVSSITMIVLAAYAFFQSPPTFRSFGNEIIEEQSFTHYVNHVNFTTAFLTTIIGMLVAELIVVLFLLWRLLKSWQADRDQIGAWRDIGFACERIEFLSGNRIRINNTELILNQAQLMVLKQLIESRIKGEALHTADIAGSNATQIIKRLREELGSKLIEKTLITNHRGKGYWIDVDPSKIKMTD